MSCESALARKEESAGRTGLAIPPAKTVTDLATMYTKAKEMGHLLSPIAIVDHIQPLHQVSLRAVMIDPEIPKGASTGPECYRDKRFCNENEVAPGKNALMKIMAAAGIQVLKRTRTDDRSDHYYSETEFMLGVQDLDGSWRTIIASREVDLRDGAPETMVPEWRDVNGRKEKTGKLVPLSAPALADKRRNISSLSETKALERGIRAILALRQKYTIEELSKPFYIPKLVADLDPAKPDEKAVLLSQFNDSRQALYGPPAGAIRAAQQIIDVAPEPEQDPRLEPGESVDGDGVIHGSKGDYTPEDFVADICGREPWDDPQPPTSAVPRRFMLTKEELAALDAGPRTWFTRFNELCQAAYDRLGQEAAAEKLAAIFPIEWPGNAAFVPAEEAKRIGGALKALVGR